MCGLGAQSVTIRAKREKRFDVVPSVDPFAPDVQREVEFRRRDLAQGAQGAALAEVNPDASFAFTRATISSSAVTSAAFHAKRAS